MITRKRDSEGNTVKQKIYTDFFSRNSSVNHFSYCFWAIFYGICSLTHCHWENEVHYTIVLWNVSAYLWVYECLVTKESIGRSYDLAWFNLSLSSREKCFYFTNAIFIYVVVMIIDMIIIVVVLTLPTAI